MLVEFCMLGHLCLRSKIDALTGYGPARDEAQHKHQPGPVVPLGQACSPVRPPTIIAHFFWISSLNNVAPTFHCLLLREEDQSSKIDAAAVPGYLPAQQATDIDNLGKQTEDCVNLHSRAFCNSCKTTQLPRFTKKQAGPGKVITLPALKQRKSFWNVPVVIRLNSPMHDVQRARQPLPQMRAQP